MLKCPNCGEENTFGKVFCMGCGSKLDLSNVNENEIEEMGREGRLLSYWPLAVVGLVVILLIMTGLAFWPPKGRIGDVKGRSSDAGIVKSQLSLTSRLTPGRKMQLSFSDKQLNEYLDRYTRRKLKTDSLSVDIEDEVIEVRRGIKFGPFGPKSFRKDIKLVLDVKYAADGDKLAVKGGSIGHLPMPGPLGKIPHSILMSSAEDLQEFKSMKYLKEITIADGRITFVLAR